MNDIIGQVPLPIFDLEPAEVWLDTPPQMGDHIRVVRGLYAHHGVYVSAQEVIHFTGTESDNVLNWSANEVIRTALADFLRLGQLQVRDYSPEEALDRYHPAHIVDYARACLGDKGYHLVFNNCEHFANVCTLGHFRSRQVERVLAGKLPLQEENSMGLFGRIGGIFRGLFGGSSGGGSRSTTSTTYEPDKVKVAEIERDTKLRLADKEQERLAYMKQAQLEFLEFQTQSQLALEQAKAQGLVHMSQTILDLQETITALSQKRMEIIEHGSLHILKEIEGFYQEMGKDIEEADDRYNTEKLPQLLELLAQYPEDSPQHKLYFRRIETDMSLQAEHYNRQLQQLGQRQAQIITSLTENKNRITAQAEELTQALMQQVQQASGLAMPTLQEPPTTALPQTQAPLALPISQT